MTLRLSIPALAFVICAGCASTTPPVNEKATASSASIRAAEEVGATHDPSAALYLQLAKEEFEHARMLTGANDKDKANRLLMRSEADAQLSLALARSENDKAAAQGAIDSVKKLSTTTVQ
jgi:hypothetical protein